MLSSLRMASWDLVVVNYRTPSAVVTLLRHLERWCLERSVARWVVDSASRDGSLDAFRRELEGVPVLALDENRGFAHAANAGSRAATARWLLFLNPDVHVEPRALDEVLAAAGRGPAVLGGICDSGPRAHGPSRGRGPGGSLAVEWVAGSLLAIPRADFEALGGFDEAYFAYFEDVDLSERAAARGLPVLALPEVRYTHRGGESFAGREADRVRCYRESRKLYLGRKYGRPAAWAYSIYTLLAGSRP
ncbi:MAG: glycosyltransferase family 2 protein [Candidatus Riflebacteria bacterium]|nr:glycosyltransferase family 2 protein [Candidatus Riflebacteria bacterium]